MKLTSILALGGALLISSHAVHAAPKLSPAPVCKTDKNSELYKMFNRLPTYVLRNFGNMERYKLIDDDLITFDKANGFIEIPYEGRSNHPDRDKFNSFQMKVFREQKGAPVLVVNSTIYSEPGVKPFLHVFRFAKNGDLVRTTEKDWPFKPYSFVLDRGRIYYNYYLPKKGNVIDSAAPESDAYGDSYEWTGKRFVKEVDEGDDGHGRPPGF